MPKSEMRKRVEEVITKLNSYEEGALEVHGFKCAIVPVETLRVARDILMSDYGIEQVLDV